MPTQKNTTKLKNKIIWDNFLYPPPKENAKEKTISLHYISFKSNTFEIGKNLKVNKLFFNNEHQHNNDHVWPFFSVNVFSLRSQDANE